MRKLILPMLLAGSAALAGCATYAGTDTAYNACGTYGYIDSDNDGWVEADEWNAYRAGTYTYWDADADGRIERDEFMNCWYGGGFYPATYYNRDYWDYYWSAFDANADGYLSADEYWSAAAWTRLDLNRNGRLDANEYRWW
mgnify:CR=1 FL=1